MVDLGPPDGSLTGQIDSATTSQVILTTPANAGFFDIFVTVTNAAGVSTQYSFSLRSVAPGGAGGVSGGAGGGGAGGAGGAAGAGGMVASTFPWPGTDTVVTVDQLNFFGTNLSGLNYQPASGPAPAVLWAIQNGPSKLYRLLWDGVTWNTDTTNDWSAGKLLHYTNGMGAPDSEGLSKAEWSDSGIYVSSERDNNNSGISRLSVLRYDTMASGAELTALNDWNLTADLPEAGANLGLEAITYIPDTALVAGGFFDEATHAPYVPANYPNHGTGLFFVGLEANGSVYGYALDHATNGYTRLATFASGQASIMDLAYDHEVGYLWGYCDNTCGNKAHRVSPRHERGVVNCWPLPDRPRV